MKDKNNFIGYIKFYGPSADDGKLDIEKAARCLLALNKVFKKYQKDVRKISKGDQFVLRISNISKKCAQLDLIINPLKELLSLDTVGFALLAHSVGFSEFGKQFFGTIGKQLALKIFSKGKRLNEVKRFIKENNVYVTLKNIEGETKEFLATEFDDYKIFNPNLGEIIQLEKGKEEDMEIGYRENHNNNSLLKINYKQKPYVDVDSFASIEDRIKEPFDESKAEEIKIVGKFIDFYGLAHKYHFSFQARKAQDDVGKQKILCIVNKGIISKIIDYLKPENSKNICISGRATRDWENKVDKIKIDWINEDENFDPNQQILIE